MQRFGDWGEEFARRHLVRNGYSIVESKYRGKHGEIDIVARDRGCLVFVEVKSRRSRAFGLPEEAITAAKRQKLMQAAQEYLQEKGLEQAQWRIDVVGIEIGGPRTRVRLTRNAVTWEEDGG